MRQGVPRYLVPVAALLVTFIAGGVLFFAVFALTESGDDDVDFDAITGIAASPSSSSVPMTTMSPAAAVTSTAMPAPSATATASPVATPAATQPPSTVPLASFAGDWRIIDTVLGGQGAGQTYAFFVSITQADAELRGGAPGAIEFSGTVAENIATVQFTQPTLGVMGIFIWTLNADGNATGTFTSSIPNSGTSELIRVR